MLGKRGRPRKQVNVNDMMSFEVKYEDDDEAGGRDDSGFGVSDMTDS